MAVFRLLRAIWVFGRIFASYMTQLGLQKMFRTSAWVDRRWKGVHARNAHRLARGCIRMRGVFIKMGQILSIMGTFLPRVYQKELEVLQDEVPSHGYGTIKKAIKRELGKDPEELYATFEHEPIAAASLGQVHRATLPNGDRLAVKVLYPDIATIIRVDLVVVRWAIKVYKRFIPIRQIERVHEQLKEMLDRETNLEHEAKCLERMTANFKSDPDTLFPRHYPELSGTTVMTMSFMDGVKITRQESLSELGLDPYDVASKLVKVFYKGLFLDGFFHADPHPGNFFVQRGPEGQPRIVVLDFGAATEVRPNLVDGMIDVLQGLFTKDDNLVIRGIDTMGFISETGDRALLERTIRKYFEKLLNLEIEDFSRIDRQDLERFADPELKKEELRAMVSSVEFPEGWFFVERSAVMMFGLCAQLAPRLNTIQVGFPYIMQFMAGRTQHKQLEATN